ncbi:phosphoribosylformylglycinamidine synthase subunit PurQ [candidate division KSB1 bacterium]
MQSKVKALVLTGFGLNCEKETALAFEMGGASADIIHVNDIIENKDTLKKYRVLAFIGGFAFGDHISAGKVLAVKFKYNLRDQFLEFIHNGNLFIGICNGFQPMVKMGVLPGFDGDYTTPAVTLAGNKNPGYFDTWVRLKVNSNSPCVFTKGIDFMEVPVRHGEGQFIPLDNSVMERIKNNNHIAVQYVHPETNEVTDEYPYNPNGSEMGIAGICDETGRIFGIMPHPEAFLYPYNHPHYFRNRITGDPPVKPNGLKIFENAVRYFE